MAAASRQRKWIWLVVVTLSLSLCATAGWWFWFDTYHLVVVHEGVLYRDGNRGMREFKAAVRKARPKTVVCLVDDGELASSEFVEEQGFLRDSGIEFIRIPIIKGGWPTTQQVREFLDLVTDPRRQPVLYHDNEGIRRAGMMMSAYQESVLGYDDRRAEADIRSFGHSERTIQEVRHFIRIYDGASRTVTTQPSAGGRE